MRRTLFYINTKKDFLLAQNYILKHKKEKVVILSSTFEGQLVMQKAGMDNEIFYIANNKLDFANNERNSYQLSKNWYKRDASFLKSMIVEGVDVGQLLITTLVFFFSEAIRAALSLEDIINATKPAKIVYLENPNIELRGGGVREVRLDANIIEGLNSIYPKIMFKKITSTDFDHKESNPIFKKFLLFLSDPISYINLAFLVIENLVSPTIFSKKDSKKILIFAQRNHFTAFLEFFKGLEKAQINYKLISSALLKMHLIQIKKAKISYTNLETYSNERIEEKSKKVSRDLNKKWENYKTSGNLKNFLKKSGFLKIEKITEKRLDLFFEQELQGTIKNLLCAKKIISDYVPKLVINMTDTTPKDMAFTQVAKNLKIPTLLIQHGTLVYDSLLHSTSDYIAAWGDESKKWWTQNIKKSKNAVFVTGDPQFDKYSKLYKEKVSYRLSKSKIKILLATSYYLGSEYQRFKLLKDYLDELSEIDQVELKIRTYFGRVKPNRLLREFVKEYNFPISVDSEENLQKQIQEADIVMAETTSLILDALILGKPVIYLCYQKPKDLLPYAKAGVAIGAYEKGDIKNSVLALKEGKHKNLAKNRPDFLKNYLFKIDGKSSQRVIDLINKITHNSQTQNGQII